LAKRTEKAIRRPQTTKNIFRMTSQMSYDLLCSLNSNLDEWLKERCSF